MMDQFAPRTEPNGIFERICPVCGEHFRTNNAEALYCTEKCKKAAHNRRNYERHRAARIAAVMRRREEKE